jgi:hypothetical protein
METRNFEMSIGALHERAQIMLLRLLRTMSVVATAVATRDSWPETVRRALD